VQDARDADIRRLERGIAEVRLGGEAPVVLPPKPAGPIKTIR